MPRPFTLGRSKRRGKSRRKTSKKVNQTETVAVNEQDKSAELQVVSQLGEPPMLHEDS